MIEADRVHHAILQQVHFSRHLNPTNAAEARRAFSRGAQAPPFSYVPLLDADELLQRLDRVDPPRDHPAGALVGRCIDGTRLTILALRDRSAAAFDRMNEAAGWYPEPALATLRFEEAERDADPGPEVSADRMIATLEEALKARALHRWAVIPDRVMAARVLVDGAKRLLKVNPDARFRPRDLKRLVVHEIDVHALRAANGEGQPLLCFETGLPGALLTEEGLAMVAEEVAEVALPGALGRQVEVAQAILHARDAGFREVFEAIEARTDPGLAWGISLRIKRGLGEPGAPGVYAKDSVYLAGRMAVRAWLDQGGDLRQLYTGKVGIEDPVGAWLAEGWLRPATRLPSWANQLLA